MAAGNTTDGLLSALDVVVLEDDRHAFPPYQAAFLARGEALAKHAGMREALSELSGRLSEKRMRELNFSVDGRHVSPREEASRFLRESGLM
jgi:glycine betaine/choline ABC-type transport system substrate-binding protein